MRRNGARSSAVVFPTLPGETFAEAPCHTEGENLWEAARDGEPDKVARERWVEAAELCGYCPALAECARLADAQESPAGVWAGRVPRIPGERAGVRRAQCGRRSGYQKHKRAGEVPCGACVEANRLYSRELKARHRGGVR